MLNSTRALANSANREWALVVHRLRVSHQAAVSVRIGPTHRRIEQAIRRIARSDDTDAQRAAPCDAGKFGGGRPGGCKLNFGFLYCSGDLAA